MTPIERPSFYDRLSVQGKRFLDDLIVRVHKAEQAQELAEAMILEQYTAPTRQIPTNMFVLPGGYGGRDSRVALPPRSELDFYPVPNDRIQALSIRESEGQLEVSAESRLRVTSTASNRILIQAVPR